MHGLEWTLSQCTVSREDICVTMNRADRTIAVKSVDTTTLHQQIYKWLRDKACLTLQQMVENLANSHGYEPNRVVIKEQMRRWGSCSTLGNINLNWRLIQAPKEVQRYVAIHELAHLSHMNHSVHFWTAVSQMMPDYESAKSWLRTNGAALYAIQATFAIFRS